MVRKFTKPETHLATIEKVTQSLWLAYFKNVKEKKKQQN